jgi:anti-anti-sigma factor
MGFAAPFAIRIETRDRVARLGLSGELDLAAAPVLHDQLVRSEEDGCAAIVLDLPELTFMDCSGLRVLLAASDRARANGHRLVLMGPRLFARQVLEIVGAQLLLDEQETARAPDRFVAGDEVGGSEPPGGYGEAGA